MSATPCPDIYSNFEYLGAASAYTDDVYDAIGFAPLFDRFSKNEIAALCQFMHCFAAPRGGKPGPGEMSGACFTISSGGGIGGTSFSPIVNAPEVAILGVNKSVMKPVWNGREFIPRLILPLSLSADHRVIDGAMATRFNAYVARLLADMRRALL